MDDVERNPVRSALFTDLYELTMARAYDEAGMDEPAVFELFFREMPASRGYMIAAGLEAVLAAVEGFGFSDEDLAYLVEQDAMQGAEAFLQRLKGLRFTGEIHAVAEGTPVFPNEPIVQVVAPLIEAQLIETLVLNQVHYATVAATKAARVVDAAAGRTVVDFGSRRAHGADAALISARATYLVGGAGTSNVLAGKRFGVPIFGTMAHSYVQAHEDESQAFARFARLYPQTTLLVDTYDTLAGVGKVIDLAKRQGEAFNVRAVRLDSGDLAELAIKARAMLDEAGLGQVKIFASSGLDEWKVRELIDAGAPIDGFGVGTKMVVSPDATDVDMAYKLVEYAGQPRMKLSSDKKILPGRKQMTRQTEDGLMVRDHIGRVDEALPGRPLLEPVMRDGQRTEQGHRGIEQLRRLAREQIEALPDRVRRLDPGGEPYEVCVSEALQSDQRALKRELAAKQAPERAGS